MATDTQDHTLVNLPYDEVLMSENTAYKDGWQRPECPEKVL